MTHPAQATKDQAFRQFFTRLRAEEIGAAATGALTAPAPQSPASPPVASSVAALAHECALQLGSSLPQLGAHHLAALVEVLQAQLAQRVLLPVTADPQATAAPLVRLTPELLAAVRALAQTPASHSRLGAAPPRDENENENEAAQEVSEEPSFSAALAADAGRATGPLSRLRGPAGEVVAKKDPIVHEVTLSKTAPIDGRMHAAGALYSVLSVHTLALLVASSASTTSTIQADEFLHHIPLDLARAEVRAREDEAALRDAAPVFHVQDLPPEDELATHETVAVETNGDSDSDSDFGADPLPPDSEDESPSAWGSLADLPTEAHEIARQVAARSSPAAHPALHASWSSVEARVLQVVSLWDPELFALPGVFEDTGLANQLLGLWRAATRHRHMFASSPTFGPGRSLEQLRGQILRVFRSKMVADPSSVCVHIEACVQELLGLPQRVPGMGDPLAIDTEEEEQERTKHHSSNIERLDAPLTLLTLLAQLCQASSAHPFPSAPSTASPTTTAAPSAKAVRHLHQLALFNLPWLARRLGRWRARWARLLSGGNLAKEPTLHAEWSELQALAAVLAFIARNYPSVSVKGDKTDPALALVEHGVVHHLLVLLLGEDAAGGDHAVLHAHASANQAERADHSAGCVAFETKRTENDWSVYTTVDAEGQVSCAIRPYASPLLTDAANQASALPLSSLTSSASPLAVVPQLLSLLASLSPSVAQLLYASPSFLSRTATCACFEKQHALTARMLPVFVSLQTRDLQPEQLLVQMPVAVTNLAVTKPAEAQASGAAASKPQKKAKKSKLVVAALDDAAPEIEVPALAADEISWWTAADAAAAPDSSPSPAAPAVVTNQALVLAALQRTQAVLTSAMAQLQVSSFLAEAGTGSSDLLSGVAGTGAASADPAALEGAVDLLQGALHALYLFASASPARRLTLALLARGQLPSRGLDPSRETERAVLDQIVATLVTQLRTALPPVSRGLQTQLRALTTPDEDGEAPDAAEGDSASSSASAEDPNSLEAQSDRLTAQQTLADSPAGHALRAQRTRLEAVHASVVRMQAWLKSLSVDTAGKKD